ncbi:Hydroperoxy fatty acid reductase gpx1 [compost metagenome]
MGKERNFEEFKGEVLLIANTASKCGFTPQYKELEELHKKYKDQGLKVLAFPCNQFGKQEPGSNEEIKNFCEINYGVTFDVFEKVDVNGENTHPVFKYLKEQTGGILGKSIKWNFTKFLIDKDGNVIDRYAPTTTPLSLEGKIKELL